MPSVTRTPFCSHTVQWWSSLVDTISKACISSSNSLMQTTCSNSAWPPSLSLKALESFTRLIQTNTSGGPWKETELTPKWWQPGAGDPKQAGRTGHGWSGRLCKMRWLQRQGLPRHTYAFLELWKVEEKLREQRREKAKLSMKDWDQQEEQE